MLEYTLYAVSTVRYIFSLHVHVSTAVGIVVYYIVICLYLYGDLAIYLVAIPKSIVTVVWYVTYMYMYKQ